MDFVRREELISEDGLSFKAPAKAESAQAEPVRHKTSLYDQLREQKLIDAQNKRLQSRQEKLKRANNDEIKFLEDQREVRYAQQRKEKGEAEKEIERFKELALRKERPAVKSGFDLKADAAERPKFDSRQYWARAVGAERAKKSLVNYSSSSDEEDH